MRNLWMAIVFIVAVTVVLSFFLVMQGENAGDSEPVAGRPAEQVKSAAGVLPKTGPKAKARPEAKKPMKLPPWRGGNDKLSPAARAEFDKAIRELVTKRIGPGKPKRTVSIPRGTALDIRTAKGSAGLQLTDMMTVSTDRKDGTLRFVGVAIKALEDCVLPDGTVVPADSRIRIFKHWGNIDRPGKKPSGAVGVAVAAHDTGGKPGGKPVPLPTGKKGRFPVAISVVRDRWLFMVEGSGSFGGNSCSLLIRYEQSGTISEGIVSACALDVFEGKRKVRLTCYSDFKLGGKKGEGTARFYVSGVRTLLGEGTLRVWLANKATKNAISNTLTVPVATDGESIEKLEARLGPRRMQP